MAVDHWNHNTAYHPWILRQAERGSGAVLDVGCGDGLLVRRLRQLRQPVIGIDTDRAAVDLARHRLRGESAVGVLHESLAEHAGRRPESYGLVCCVAALHHVELRAGLRWLRELASPGGTVLVVGLSANSTVTDWVLSGLALPVVRTTSWLRHQRSYPDMVTAPAQRNLADIRRTAEEILPGARIRRALYYRYLLRWDRPLTAAT